MTFIQGIIRPERVWLCADKQLSYSNGVPVNDKNVKILSFDCLDGNCLLAYTGVAILRDGSYIPDWIRSTIRGDHRTIESVLKFIQSRANRDISNYGHLLLLIAVASKQTIGLYQITNLKDEPYPWSLPPSSTFSLGRIDIPKPYYFAAGSGASMIHPRESERLAKIVKNKPRNYKDYTNLLFHFNKIISERDSKRVSISATSATMPVEGKPVSLGSYKIDDGNSKATPVLIYGIDLTDLLEFTSTQFSESVKNNSSGFDSDFNNKVIHIAQKGVIPRK